MPPKQQQQQQQQRKGKGPLRRTVELPAALRQELQDLGHIPIPGKGKLGRKEKRKAAREETKQRRASHFGGAATAAGGAEQGAKGKGKGKRKAEQQEQQQQQQPSKRSKVDSAPVPSSAEPPAPKAHQTPLEKLLLKQQARAAPAASSSTGRAKSGAELAEDQEIAWLEAKLGVRGGDPNDKKSEKGAWKGEMMEDGLDDLFGGLEDLEAAAFGSSNKEYARLLRQQQEGSDYSGSSDEEDDDDDLEAGLDALEYGGIDSGSASDDDDEDGAFGEDGISDEELRDPGDDDDHREMGEVGSDVSDSMEEEFGSDEEEESGNEEGLDEEEDEEAMMREFEEAYGGAEGDEEEEEEEGGMTMTFGADGSVLPSTSTTAPAAPAPAPKKGAYIPPHLRQAAPAPSAPSPASATNEPPIDPRLRRSMQGHLNKLSPLNISSILTSISSLYSSNPRAIVSATLTQLLLEMISGRDNLGEQLLVTYAALVAGLTRTVGIEFGAGVVAKAVGMFEDSLSLHVAARAEGKDEENGGFEGRPGSKECLNLVAFVAELYNFGVVACVLVYDFVRMLIESGRGLEELEVELLSKVVKRSGQQLRQDDPSALKEIINLVKAKQQGIDASSMNSRTRFMIDSLTNLKNNKTPKPDANGAAVDHYSGLRKWLTGLRKGGSTPDPLRITLSDLHSSTSKGKWWLVGAAWGGDPLVDQPEFSLKDPSTAAGGSTSDAKMAKLAKKQGMNTDIRKGVFTVLMTSEDYVDACERLLQLGLSDVQQREIARVLLQCCGNEKSYNPYYTLVAHRMATKSHSFVITLQYCLWDFLRELGEKKVGGEEMVKNLDLEETSGGGKVSKRRITNLSKLYAWCVAKEVLSLMILKPIPFGNPKPLTLTFLTQFFTYLLISTQTPSPALLLSATSTRKDKEAIERVFIKAAPHGALLKGLGYFFETAMEEAEERTDGERERKVVRFGIKVAKETLSSSSGIVVDLR